MASTANQSGNTSTFSALRNSNFRLYFAGQLVSVSGTWMQNLAQGFLVFKITQSEAWLGIVACAAGLPVILLSPISGVMIERVPRRRLMLVTQTIQMALAFILFALTLSDQIQVWHLVVLAFMLGTTNALDLPARQTFVVEMVGPDDLRSGIALNSILNSASRVLGPMAAGIALVQIGPAWCFFVNGLSFLAVIASLLLMQVPYPIQHQKHLPPLQQLREGLQYARRDATIRPLLLLAVIGGIFVVPISNLLPAFADVVLHSPKEGYAALSVGQGVGSVITGVAVGWLAYRFGYRKLIAWSVAIGGAATIWLALEDTIPLATVAAGVAGAFLILQFVSINTMIQTAVPDAFRGRVLALYTLSFLGMAPFGALALGGIANVIGVTSALAIYGVLGIVLSAVVLWQWYHASEAAQPSPEARVEEVQLSAK